MSNSLTRLKYIARFGYGDSLPEDGSSNDNVSVYGSNGAYDLTNKANTQSPAIIIGRKGSYGKINLSTEPCFASDTTFFIDASKTKHDLKWLFYALQTLRLDEGSNEAAVPGLNRETAYNNRIPLFSLDYQRQIADYLDRETGRIDDLIDAKEDLLTKLSKKRQALITQAVTRGLDANVPTKPSGIDWLGNVPEHWKVERLKHIAQVRGGIAVGKDYYPKQVVAYPYLRVANVQDGALNLEEIKTIELPEEEAKSYFLEVGDVLMNEGGDSDKLGRGAVWDGSIMPCLHQNHVFAVRPSGVTSAWLNMWTNSDVAKAYFESRAKKATNLASISSSNVKELFILVPSGEEQLQIVSWIDRQLKRVDRIQKEVSNSINLLKENRSSLITAAVTGQLEITKDYAD